MNTLERTRPRRRGRGRGTQTSRRVNRAPKSGCREAGMELPYLPLAFIPTPVAPARVAGGRTDSLVSCLTLSEPAYSSPVEKPPLVHAHTSSSYDVHERPLCLGLAHPNLNDLTATKLLLTLYFIYYLCLQLCPRIWFRFFKLARGQWHSCTPIV